MAQAGAKLGGAVWPEAEQAARAAVQAQPFRESARAALMEVLRARGNVNEALRVYEDVRVLLREELGSNPGRRPRRAPRAAPARRPRPRAGHRPPPGPRRRRPARASSSATARSRCWTACWPRRRVGEGRAVLIEGPPGIGKSRLLAEFRRRATADGAQVLNARAGELEREFPFGVVRQLFEAAVGDPDVLAGAAAPARVVFEYPDNGTPAGDASFAALHGLYWLALNLAAERPLLLEVDDLHWCDRPSPALPRLPGPAARGPARAGHRVRAHRRRTDRRRAAGRDRQRPVDRPRPPRPALARRRSASSSPSASAPSPTRRSARPATAPPAATRCSSAS